MRRTADYTKDFQPVLSADIVELDDSFKVQVDLPGVKKNNLEVYVLDGSLNIKASREQENTEDTIYFHSFERAFGSVHRSIVIPSACDMDSVNTKFENGVLTITFKKKVTSEKKQIEVK